MKGQLARLLLLTDDIFLAEALGTYTRRDHIEIDRSSSIADALRAIDEGIDGIVVDLSKRGMAGQAILDLATVAMPRQVPILILSAQPRRDLLEFAKIVQAVDVLSKTEPMTDIATRIRLCVRTPLRAPANKPRSLEGLGWALA